MSDALVSVITPCYRQGHFLSQALDSVLMQSHPAVEPIVVNDGSDDETEEVAIRYSDRIRYVLRNNGGLSAARNEGIHAATGKYLLFLDSDDALHPDAVARLVEAAEAGDDGFAVMGFRVFEESPQRAIAEYRPSHTTTALPQLIHRNLGPPHCFLCSRSAVLEAGCFEAEAWAWGCEDWDLWLRLALAGKEVKGVPFVGAYYRRYAGSMSTNQVRMLQGRADVLIRAHRAIIESGPLLAGYGKELFEAEHRVLRRLVFQRGDLQRVLALRTAMDELIAREVRVEPSHLRGALEALFGYWSTERVMQCILPLLRPSVVAFYNRGFH